MTNDALMDQHTQTIIKRYTRIYEIFFKYSIFFIPVIAGLVVAGMLQSRDKIPQNIGAIRTQANKSYSEINGIYRAERISDQVGPIFSGNGNIDILAGELQIGDNVIVGRNNLIKLHGIILPSNTYVIDTQLSGDITQFDNEYSITSLKWIVENRFLSSVPAGTGVTTTNINAMFLPKSNPLDAQRTNMEMILETLQKRMYFAEGQATKSTEVENVVELSKRQSQLIAAQKLGCLTMPKLFGGFCDKNLSSFIQKIPGINLEKNWKDILAIATQLQRKDHIALFCENIMANVLKNPFPSSELDTVMNGICSSYNDRYIFMKDFLSVQHELEGIASPNLAGQSLDLNLFKLVSLWQKIASQSRKKTLDTSLLSTYLQFSETILQQPSMKIPQFYTDAMYYFHNIYLKNILQTIAISSVNPATKNDVSLLNAKIIALNKGNESIGLIGLENRIHVATIAQEIKNESKLTITSIRDFEKAFTDSMRGFPDISIHGIQTDNASQSVSLVGSLANPGGSDIGVAITFRYQYGAFIPTVIRVPQYAITDSIVAAYMQHNPEAPLGILLDLLRNNLDVVETQEATICDSISIQKDISVESCDTTQARINIGESTVIFTFTSDTITQATSEKAAFQAFLDKTLSEGSIPQYLVGATIQSLVNLTKVKIIDTGDVTSIDQNVLAIIRKTKEFLHVAPTEVKKQDNSNTYLIQFEMSNYKMAAVMNIEKNYKMSPLAIQVQSTVITIPDFSLTLMPFSQNSINHFTNDPLDYIRLIDEKAYNKIQEALAPQNKK